MEERDEGMNAFDKADKTTCAICGRKFEQGITIWPCPLLKPRAWAHPECILGVAIDHGD